MTSTTIGLQIFNFLVLSIMIDENLAAAFGMPELTIISHHSITPELAEKCYHMGETTYYADSAVDLQTYKNKFNAVPDFCFVFMHKELNEPVGYFIILPLNDDAIKRYMKNELSFDTIQPGDLQRLKPNSLYNLFFDTKAVVKQYRTPEMAKMFFSLLIDAMVYRAKNFTLCNYILIDAYKEFSKTLAEVLETKLLTTHKYTNGFESELYGSIFNYKNFQGSPNYTVLDFAYSNDQAVEILQGQKDLWAE